MNLNAYVLTIDDGRQLLQVTDQEGWSRIVERNMTIVMSIIMTQAAFRKKYQCPFCDVWNRLKDNDEQSSMDWWVFCRSLHIVLLIYRQSILQATLPGQAGWSRFSREREDRPDMQGANCDPWTGFDTEYSPETSEYYCRLTIFALTGVSPPRILRQCVSHPTSTWFNTNFVSTTLNSQPVRNPILRAFDSILTSAQPLGTLACV